MRGEQEMMKLIVDVAQTDIRICAVYLNGSRANPNVMKDKYQDFDIVYVVTETTSFIEDKEWIKVFGDIAMVQEPDSKEFGWGQSANKRCSYAWLMLFKDGNRIDLQIQTKEKMNEVYTKDSLTIPLLDKDRILPSIPTASERGYWIKKPDQASYDGCCNEFWWCLNNVAKGLVRNHLPYVMRMYHEIVHTQLDQMLEYYIGIDTNFSVSVGMWGKYFNKYLPKELYDVYIQTFASCNQEQIWNAVFLSCRLFREVAIVVGKELGYVYPQEDDDNMMAYLKQMSNEAILLM